MPQFRDLANLSERDRIEMIVRAVRQRQLTVGFIVDLTEEGTGVDGGDGPRGAKGDRYIAAIKAMDSRIEVYWRGDGPVAGVETIKVGPARN